MARVYRQADGALVAHVMNCSGATPAEGTTVPAGLKLQPDFPVIRDLVMTIRTDDGDNLRSAVWYPAVSGEPRRLEAEKHGQEVKVRLPELREYGILRFARSEGDSAVPAAISATPPSGH